MAPSQSKRPLTTTQDCDAINAIVTPSSKKPKKEKQVDVEKEARKAIRGINSQIKLRLKWKNSYKAMKGGNMKKGCRVEVPCSYAEVFESIFGDAGQCKRRGEALSFKTTEDADVFQLPFNDIVSYRYNSAELCAPIAASFKDHKITLSFKFCIH